MGLQPGGRGGSWVLLALFPPSWPPSLPHSLRAFMENLCVPGTVWNRANPALPSQSPQSLGKDKGQADRAVMEEGGRLGHWAQRRDPTQPRVGPIEGTCAVPSRGALIISHHSHLTHIESRKT